MKNNFSFRLFLLAVAFSLCTALNAQTTILTQNFETSKTVIPAGWSQEKSTSDGGWVFGNSYGTNMNNYVATHTYCAYVDAWDNDATNISSNDTLKTSSFVCSTFAHVFVSVDMMFWMDDGAETANLVVSTDGGKTWGVAANIASTGGGWANGSIYDISALAGGQANVMVGFTYYNGYGSVTNGYVAVGMAVDNITVYSPVNYDLNVASQNLPYLMQVGAPYTFTGTINNYGGDSVVSMNLNYSVNHGPAQVDNITGLSGFNGATSYNFSHNKAFTPTSAGNYSVRIWADNLNSGNIDGNHKNDTLAANFTVVDTVQARVALYEDVIGQSCYYCMLSGPNVDSVTAKNKNIVNFIHYHVPYPTTPDYMYSVNTAIGSAMISYYSVSGTPTGELDGQTLYPGDLAAPQDYSTPNVVADVNIGSPFKINITSCTHNTSTDVYSLTANIVSYGAFAAGLSAKVALVVDSLTYKTDYSADDPKASFVPPLGTTSAASGGSPDYLYEQTLKFSNVVEGLLPASGTTLTAFTAGQTQTINVSWTKNHPWSLTPKTYPYDSSLTAHMVVFVQTNAGIKAGGVAAKFVYQSASALVNDVTGINEVANGVGFNMYPNPSNGATTITYSLDKDQAVSLEVYDMLGQKVYSVNNGNMGAGQHSFTINGQQLQAGVYMVKFITDNSATTQKLVIE